MIKIEEELALYSIVIIAKPSKEDLNDLKRVFNVTQLNNYQIQIAYK